MGITSSQAATVVDAALQYGQEQGMEPLAVVVLDAGGHLVPALYGGAGDETDFSDVDAARAEQEVEQLRQEWLLADEAVASVPFTAEIEVRGDVMSLRMVYVHLVGEYARHNGHADLLRQALDGVTGR